MYLVRDNLKAGRVNAERPKDLARRLGFASVRALQQEVEAERRAGAVILCDPGGDGYFLSNDPVEIRRFISALEHRAKNTMLAAESARQLLAKIGGDGD